MSNANKKIHMFLKGGLYTVCGLDILTTNVKLTCGTERITCNNCIRTKAANI